jgi:hypothetical protein
MVLRDGRPQKRAGKTGVEPRDGEAARGPAQKRLAMNGEIKNQVVTPSSEHFSQAVA